MSILVTYPIPFLAIFFERLANLTYPKDRIDLITFCSVSVTAKPKTTSVASEST